MTERVAPRIYWLVAPGEQVADSALKSPSSPNDTTSEVKVMYQA